MGRITTSVHVVSYLDPSKELDCDVLVDTGATMLTLPRAWKERLGLPVLATVRMETADGRRVEADVCGPVRLQIRGFHPVSDDVAFIDMDALGGSEPLLGHIPLQKSGAVVDMVGHRLVQGPPLDLKTGRA